MRSAAGIEGIVILAVIFGFLNLISKAKRVTRNVQSPGEAERTLRTTTRTTEATPSLESILRQIEAVKQQRGDPRPSVRTVPDARPATPARPRPAPQRLRPVEQDERGPLGRGARTPLADAEDVEDRTSLEDEGALMAERRLRSVESFQPRPERVVEDRDDAAAMIAQRRIASVEARNRPLAAVDHAAFDQAIRKPEQSTAPLQRPARASLREAMIWREILGPPKALQEE